MLMPMGGRAIVRRMPALFAARAFVSGVVVLWIVFAALMSVASHDLHPTSGVLAIAAFGALNLLWIASMTRRRIPSADPKTVRAFVIQTTFVGVALGGWVTIIGFISFFVARRGQLLLYLVSIPFGFAGMMLLAPTRRRLEKLQSQLKELGSEESIITILSAPPEPRPLKPRRPRGRRFR